MFYTQILYIEERRKLFVFLSNGMFQNKCISSPSAEFLIHNFGQEVCAKQFGQGGNFPMHIRVCVCVPVLYYIQIRKVH